MRVDRVDHHFVQFIPDELEPATLYISIEYATVAHSCLCGCGGRVVTPLGPTDWRLTYNGETITLAPSVGNWSFECQSHYVIRQSKVIWGRKLSGTKIDAVRERDRLQKKKHYAGRLTRPSAPPGNN